MGVEGELKATIDRTLSNPVSWNLQLAGSEEQLSACRQLTNEMVMATQEEPGMVTYEWFFSKVGSTCHNNER